MTTAAESDEALCLRLRDLALVDLDALVAGLPGTEVVAAYADDVANALEEARTRVTALRATLGGADPLNVLELPARRRASEAGTNGAERIRARLVTQAEAARSLARVADLAAALVPKLFEADRRR
jgi:hypothetical protein